MDKVVAYGAGATVTWVVAGYAYDVVWRGYLAYQRASQYAVSVGKPLLVVGAGTPRTSLRSRLFGTLKGDVNIDIAGAGPCSAENVCRMDVMRISYPDRYFGAALASHILEHVADPEGAWRELERVADRVYVVWPQLWWWHTWMHPGHAHILPPPGRR